MPHWSFSKVTTGTGAMAATATISVTTCACHLKLLQAGAAVVHLVRVRVRVRLRLSSLPTQGALESIRTPPPAGWRILTSQVRNRPTPNAILRSKACQLNAKVQAARSSAAVGFTTQLPRVVVGKVVASCSGPDFLMLEATGCMPGCDRAAISHSANG
eukprot:scaffold31399_cov54-Phaeocystis_antarctica.AAC.2